MPKRPPQRSLNRKPAGQDAAALLANGMAQPPADAPDGVAATAEAQAKREPQIAVSREEFVQSLADLRGQGNISVADEAAILREYDSLLVQLRAEKSKLEAEYRERIDRDGQEATHAWLAEAAEALGRRQGERMRQLFKTIPALAPESPPA